MFDDSETDSETDPETDAETRAALRAITEGAEPPVSNTTVERVVRLGRRRRFRQRAATSAVVVSVLAGLGAGAVVMAAPVGPGTDPAAQASLLPGWHEVATPPGERSCDGALFQRALEPPLPSKDDILEAFRSAVDSITEREFVLADFHESGVLGSYQVREGTHAVSEGKGFVITVSAHSYDGTPTEAADWYALQGTCQPIGRRVLDDGTVFQLDSLLGRPTKTVQIFLPTNRVYLFTATGMGDNPRNTLTDAELVAIGEKFVARIDG
ncbi:hypothetical protein [Actinophytocola sediminis]